MARTGEETLELLELGIQVPIAELYEDVDFTE